MKFGFAQYFSVDRVGRSGGLAIFWKQHVACEIMNYSRNHIDVLFLDNDIASWRLTCFYGYPERSRRSLSWDLIRSLTSSSQLPWCIYGDFNDLLYPSDKKGSLLHPTHLLEGFQATINDCMLTEIDLKGGNFT